VDVQFKEKEIWKAGGGGRVERNNPVWVVQSQVTKYVKQAHLVIHSCNTSYSGGRGKRIVKGLGQPR
jgi:hypothetical protein